MRQYYSKSAAETTQLGYELGQQLISPSVICFFGDLAAGKTTFIKGLVASATHIHTAEVQSPTFTYLNIYQGTQTVYHFDLYRLRDADEFLSMGFDEYLEEGICCIEWSERIVSLLPVHYTQVILSHEGEDNRKIMITQK